jgi:hypothetical protein
LNREGFGARWPASVGRNAFMVSGSGKVFFKGSFISAAVCPNATILQLTIPLQVPQNLHYRSIPSTQK